MIVEIVNPSDRAYMQHDNAMVLALAGMLIGAGYGLQDIESDWRMPPLFRDAWFEDEFGIAPDKALEENRQAVADALSTTRLAGSVSEYELAVGLDGDALAKHHDDRRTSMNDFADYARHVATLIHAEER